MTCPAQGVRPNFSTYRQTLPTSSDINEKTPLHFTHNMSFATPYHDNYRQVREFETDHFKMTVYLAYSHNLFFMKQQNKNTPQVNPKLLQKTTHHKGFSQTPQVHNFQSHDTVQVIL